jgi:hypothetical protein
MTYRLLIEESGSASRLNTLFYIIALSMLMIFLFRAAVSYGHYKGSIFQHVYDNYLFDYFYKLNIMQDVSRSSLVKKLIGNHRITYASITNKEGKLVSQIMTLIHARGILSIAYLNTSGKVSGNLSGDWLIRRTEDGKEKRFKIDNPAVYLKEYITHLSDTLEGKKVDTAIALNDTCDISDIHVDFKVVHYSEIPELIKNTDCGYGLNDAQIEEIYEKLGGRKH